MLWVKGAIAAGAAVALLLSPKLWISSRAYPLTPVLPFLKPLPFPFDVALYAAAVAALFVIAIVPRATKIIFVFGALALMLGLFDQSRWQPWFYQYLFMLLAVALAPTDTGALNTCRLIVACTYFWSGLQKTSGGFAGDVFPWMAEPITQLLPGLRTPMHAAAYAAPFIEAGIGIALLTTRLRTAGIVAGLAMHVFILLGIGPLGHNVNAVVWPWNVVMMICLVALFARTPAIRFGDMAGQKFAFHRAAAVLFGFAPLLSFFNLWDNYLSAALYAGNRNNATIYLSDSVLERLPDPIADYVTEDGANRNALDVSDWSYGELRVPPYPEIRIYRNVAKTLCAYLGNGSGLKLVIRGKAAWIGGRRQATYGCEILTQE